MLKLQSAMEYLTTYGWAILILGLALVVLFDLIAGATSSPTQQCLLPAGFSCTNYFMDQNGLLTLNLLQSTSSPISVTALGCGNPESVSIATMNYPGNQMDTFPTTMPANIPIGSNYTFSIQCFSNSTHYFGSISETYSGYLTINYTDAYTDFPNTVYGRIVAKVAR